MSAIASVEAIVLRAPAPEELDLDGSRETVVVRIVDEDGCSGIGEADAPAAVVRELVEMDDVHGWSRGLAAMLRGRDPFEIASLSADLYQATIYHGRRGLGIHALSAVDVALYDLVGKQLGRPVYQLLGGARREAISPYATIYAGPETGRTARDYMDDLARRCESALALGFRAIKVEPLFGGLATDRELVDYVRESRRVLGRRRHDDGRLRLPLARLARRRSGRLAASRTRTCTSRRRRFSTTTWRATGSSPSASRHASAGRSSQRRCTSAASGSSAAAWTCSSPTSTAAEA